MGEQYVRATATEIGALWSHYLTDSANVCVFSYFIEKVEDTEIKPVLEHALQLSKKHLQTISAILTKENQCVPHGFKVDEDVDLTAPRLYTDTYFLHNLHQMVAIGLTTYAGFVAASVRADITDFYTACLHETTQLYKMSKDLLLSKGLYTRSPFMPEQNHVAYVEKQGFIWDIFAEKRPLTALEISNLFANIQRNALGTVTLMGYGQVSQSKEVTKYILRGKDIAKKHIDKFCLKMKECDLPVPGTWDTEVTESTAYTYSDKLSMFMTTGLIMLSIGYYGTSAGQSPRADLALMYNKLSAEIQTYLEDGANLMIKNHWLEQPPMAANREKIANESSKKE